MNQRRAEPARTSPTGALGAADWDARYTGRDLVWSAEPNRFIVQQVEGLAPGRALDLATGEGRNAVWLAERGWEVTAVDFSAAGLEKARARARQRGVMVTWVQADLASWRPPPSAFDLVLLAYLHAGAALLRTALAGASAALAPGGVLIVVGHARDNLERGYGGPQDPTLLYTPDLVVKALPDLEIQRAEQVLRPVRREDGSEVRAVDTLVWAVRPPA